MGIKRTASSRQIDLGMQNQWFLSILQHKMQKTKLPYFSLYFWADSFENLKCQATAHFLTENSEIFSGSLFLITTGLVNSPWWNSTKLQILDTLMCTYINYFLHHNSSSKPFEKFNDYCRSDVYGCFYAHSKNCEHVTNTRTKRRFLYIDGTCS